MNRNAGRLFTAQRALRLALLVGLLNACSPQPTGVPEQAATTTLTAPATFVGAIVCSRCHQQQYSAWRNSHHDLAMQELSPATVLGDFNDATFKHLGTVTTFSQQDERFFVRTDGPDGEPTDFEIAYTFGVEPLQQYLVEFPDGRLQALSIAWDTRSAASGGQRWFHLYPDQRIDNRDPLHWTRPLQNWNFMCAACHSTGLQKNYQPDTDRFATSWAEIDVACEACHGPGSQHILWAGNGPDEKVAHKDGAGLVSLQSSDNALWLMNTTTGIAKRSQARTSQAELETCARCHARRSAISEDPVNGQPLLNTHQPALIPDRLYFADGQIMDEVYVYGSFLQSRMHNAGVTCSNCHDPHSLELKAPGNGVCAQCHLPERFDTSQHHHHSNSAASPLCADCHMPSRTYMVVDTRRDHSFRIPRPDLTVAIGTPNACNTCHDDQLPDWAARSVEQWYGPRQTVAPHYGEVLDAGRRGFVGAGRQLINLADDTSIPGIVRATALTLLQSNPDPGGLAALQRAAAAADPLLRLAAAQAAPGVEPAYRIALLAPLLSDPIRAVRLQAVTGLVTFAHDDFSPGDRKAFDAALAEYRATQWLNADRPESRLNLGALYVADGDLTSAIGEYRRAMEMSPEFPGVYLNLAELYRDAGSENSVEAVLRQGLTAAPDSAELYHALGLSKVRQQQYDDAIVLLRKAAELDPDNVRYAYVFAIALNSTGNSTQALRVLQTAYEHRPGDHQVTAALATISYEQGDFAQAEKYARRLLIMDSNDPVALQLLQSLNTGNVR